MAITQGDGSNIGGTGGSGINCRISSADEVGIIENLLERIRECERDIARLKAENMKVKHLDELGNQVGWVTGVTYMGVEGWTRTQAGTLIPPPGVSLASLGIVPPQGPPGSGAGYYNQLGLIIKDENGNIIFGANSIDGLYGSKVDEWDAAGNAEFDYGIAHYDELSGVFTHSQRGVTWVGGQVFELEFNCVQAGLYLVGAHIDVYHASSADAVLYINNGQNTTTLNGLYTRGSSNDPGELVSLSLCGIVSRQAGENIRASRSGSGLTTQQFHLHITRLSG